MAYRFGDYLLDAEGRRLMLGDRTVPISPRYFDALHLLVAEAGTLVTKDRFIDEVWAGVPVTDEALTQCIRVLRRALGDAVSAPRFIETAPKHGYRFIAPVQQVATVAPPFRSDIAALDKRLTRSVAEQTRAFALIDRRLKRAKAEVVRSTHHG